VGCEKESSEGWLRDKREMKEKRVIKGNVEVF